MDARNLRYILCPGTGVSSEDLPLYNMIYSKWRDLWQETLDSLHVNHPLHSESFTRQHYFGCLFDGEKIVALCSFRWTHAEELGFHSDSYFSTWYPLAIHELKSRGARITICGNFCIDHEYRGNLAGYSAKDLLMGMVVETFMNSPTDCLAGAVRINRKMNDVTLRWGAKLIAQDVPSGYGDANVDLIGFFRDVVETTSPHELKSLAQRLWTEKLILGKSSFGFDLQVPKPLRRTA